MNMCNLLLFVVIVAFVLFAKEDGLGALVLTREKGKGNTGGNSSSVSRHDSGKNINNMKERDILRKLESLRNGGDGTDGILLLEEGEVKGRENIVLFAGQIRSFRLAAESILKYLVQPYDADVGMCVWGNHTNDEDDVKFAREFFGERNIMFIFMSKIDIRGHYDNIHRCPCNYSNFHENDKNNNNSNSDFIKPTMQNLRRPNVHYHPTLADRHVDQQLYSWYKCNLELSKIENKSGHKYSFVIRHRFDIALWSPYPSISDLNLTVDDRLFYSTSFFEKFPGINDRIFISNRRVADIAFSTFAFGALLSDERETCWLDNTMKLKNWGPEMMLGYHLNIIHGIELKEIPKPFLYGILEDDGTPRHYLEMMALRHARVNLTLYKKLS